MPLPAAPVVAGIVGAFLWLTSSSGGAGTGAGGLAEQQWLEANPGKSHDDFIAWVKARGAAAQGAADAAQSGEELPEVNAELRAYAEIVPWSGEWLRFWSDAMGLPPIPSSLRALYNEKNPHALKEKGRGGYIYALASGLRIVPGAAKAGETGEPKEWAKAWIKGCDAYGPSPTVGGTLYTWGPMFGLTVEGAKRAEHLGYRPSKWQWTVKPGKPTPLQGIIAGKPSPEHVAGYTGFEVSKGVVDALSAIPLIGTILSLVVGTVLDVAQKAAHYDREIGPLTAAADPSGLLTIYGVAQLEQAGGTIDADAARADAEADLALSHWAIDTEADAHQYLPGNGVQS